MTAGAERQPVEVDARARLVGHGQSPNGSRISRPMIIAITLVVIVIARASVISSIGHS